MLLATNTLGATRGGAGVGVGVGVGVGSGVGVALGVADTVAVGLADGAELAALGVPQAASNTGAMKVSSTFFVICVTSVLRRGGRGGGRCPLRGGGSRHATFACLRESCSRARYSRYRYLYAPGLPRRSAASATTGSVQQILSWPEIVRLAAANDDVLDALQEVIEPFGFLGNIEEHGDI
jgi:hypothetical protein